MEVKISVAEILKDKPQGVKLYSRICGAVELKEVLDVRKKKSIVVKELNSSNQHRFWYDGKFFRAGQCVLQPSKEMRNWNKFSWKKGDVLVTENGAAHIIFEKFTDDTYTIFAGKYYYCKNGAKGYTYLRFSDNAITEEFTIETEDAAKTYISFIEKRLGGKLNRETLEIEKAQPEFKIGDILFVKYNNRNIIFILSNINGKFYNHRVRLDSNKVIINYSDSHFQNEGIEFIRYATEEEKQQLFDALAKEGKAWDAKKKMLVDLETKVDELKPFDKVLVKNDKEDQWSANIFSYQVGDMYYCLGECYWRYCIPYIGNESLLGTTKDVEG